MLIICLVKGVPAKTTQVVTVSGVLRREEMDLVLNPHDAKAVEAAYYIKRVVGGKMIALSMGPEPKIAPIMNDLLEPRESSFYVPRISFSGFDERIILSDRRMAGADTWATSYTLACGIRKLLSNHVKAAEKLIEVVRNGSKDDVLSTASQLHSENIIPNYIYSRLPTIKQSLIQLYVEEKITKDELLSELENYKKSVIEKFIVVAGMKTSDGETGNTGPQTAEALSQMLGFLIPSVAFVRDFEINPDGDYLIATRKIGNIMQKLRIKVPCVLTIDAHYEPRVPPANNQFKVRKNNYSSKLKKTIIWNADDIEADPSKLGFYGSPTIVGPGYEIGKPPVQKFVGETLTFKRDVPTIEWNGKKYGPFRKGDITNTIPEDLLRKLREENIVDVFTLEELVDEVFEGLKVVARAV